jgi:hypothetical protein
MSADSDRIIMVDNGVRLEEMIAAGGYDSEGGHITPENFPIENAGIRFFRTRLFQWPSDVLPENAVAHIKRSQFAPATHIHGLAYGATFPEEQREEPIACPGFVAAMSGFHGVLCLGGSYAKRSLFICPWKGVWPSYWRFLGVQEVEGIRC